MAWLTRKLIKGRKGRGNHTSMRQRIELALRQLHSQIAQLEQAAHRLAEKDRSMFAQVMRAIKASDMTKASVVANELVQIRKMERMVTQARLAFEQIAIRLNTVRDMGDMLVSLQPAIGVVKSIQGQVAGLIPGAESELNELSTLLGDLLVQARGEVSQHVNVETHEDAEEILAEAAAQAEKWIKEQLPDIPEELKGGGEGEREESLG